MMSMKLSHVSLVVGLVVAVMAFWTGAAPVGTSGDLVTGGWTTCWDQNGNILAATSVRCDPCDGTIIGYCYEYNMDCDGGTITVVRAAAAGHTPHATGYAPCTQGSCHGISSGTCY